jgi:hypothetical protein
VPVLFALPGDIAKRIDCLVDTLILILILMLSGSALAFAGQRTELAAQAW